MRKNNPNIRALKMLISFNPRYFPLFTLYTLVWHVSPFFNLWLSADIVTALYDGADKTRIWTLVIMALGGNLLIALLSAILRRIAGHEYAILFQRERAAFLQKTLSLDYDKLEDPEIRTLRRTITENSYINSNGIHRLRWSIILPSGVVERAYRRSICDILSCKADLSNHNNTAESNRN